MRRAEHRDLDWFVQAGEAFCEISPYNFDADSYAEQIRFLTDDPDTIAIVVGEPVHGHSVARLIPSFYHAGEIVARVFTTWGQGGLRCFREVERLSREAGARYLVADAMHEPRIADFYRRRGMVSADTLFIKEL